MVAEQQQQQQQRDEPLVCKDIPVHGKYPKIILYYRKKEKAKNWRWKFSTFEERQESPILADFKNIVL